MHSAYMLRDVHLVDNVTPLIFLRNLILDASLAIAPLQSLPNFHDRTDRVGKKRPRLFRKLGALFHF